MNKLFAHFKDLTLDFSKGLTRSPRTPPHLPGDVIELIVAHRFPDVEFDSPEFLSCDSYRSEEHRKSHIAPFSLLSRAWLAPARRALYRSITEAYNDENHGPLLWDTIQKYPHVRKYIRRMFLRNPLAASHFRDIITLLPLCTILLALPSSDIDDPDLIFASTCPGYLRFEHDDEYSVSTETWHSGFRSWSRLQVLELVGIKKPMSLDDLPPGEEDYLPSLRVLKLRLMSGRATIPPTTSNTLHTIVFSECRHAPILNGLTSLLDRHASSLRRLCIENAPAARPLIECALPNLRLLEIFVACGFYVPDPFLLQMPPSIVHISIRIVLTDQTQNYCATLIENKNKNKNSHPRLRMIELFAHDVRMETIDEDQWELLARTAGKVGIQLLVKSDHSNEQLLPAWARQE
jgi:hypothetical protein